MALAVMRDTREYRSPESADELERFEVDVLAGFVLTRASAGLADAPIRSDVSYLEQICESAVGDGAVRRRRVLRPIHAHGEEPHWAGAGGGALTTHFEFLELRHNIEIHAMTGRTIEWPNR